MGPFKASIIVLSGLAALAGGAVVLRDGGVDRLAEITRVAMAPEPQMSVSEPAAAPDARPETEATGSSSPDLAASPEPPQLPPEHAIEEGVRPAIDVVRLEPDGRALVSGTGYPGGAIEILVNGSSVWLDKTDSSGTFVAFVTLPRSPIARMMWLRGENGLGEMVQSDGSIVLAPSPEIIEAPEVALSEADPSPEEEPSVTQTEMVATAESAISTPTSTADPTAVTAGQTSSDRTATTAEPRPVVTEQIGEPVELEGAIATAAAPVETDRGAAVPSQEIETQPRTTAVASVPALQSNSQGVRPLTPVPVAPEQGIALDTVRYGNSGEVILAGRAEGAERDLEIYLDGEVAARARTSSDGEWQAVLADVPAGDYQLRADLSDPSGGVAARIDLPFRREAPERLETVRIAAEEADQSAALITVQPGFSLWAIARDRYGDGLQYVTVYEANTHQIVNPDLIYPGQVLTLPAGGATGE